ncbi:hypothetical protein [uncultured Arcticibacterium sp.]|uniref:hypothetical protein n=1 Tax=uncultured Arcticibacterium sp. TaxID=2173042 RepID=UPI0030F7BD2D
MMVEVFITNITKESHLKSIEKLLKEEFTKLLINFDLDETGQPYPCGHTVLRVEGQSIDAKKIISVLQKEAVLCEIMKDEVCNKHESL